MFNDTFLKQNDNRYWHQLSKICVLIHIMCCIFNITLYFSVYVIMCLFCQGPVHESV